LDELLRLAQAGPVAILLVGIVALTRAFLTGAVVPGWVYKAEKAQREKAEAQVVELVKAASALTKVVANGGVESGASSGR